MPDAVEAGIGGARNALGHARHHRRWRIRVLLAGEHERRHTEAWQCIAKVETHERPHHRPVARFGHRRHAGARQRQPLRIGIVADELGDEARHEAGHGPAAIEGPEPSGDEVALPVALGPAESRARLREHDRAGRIGAPGDELLHDHAADRMADEHRARDAELIEKARQPHSMTTSARAMMPGGIVRPSVCAVLRLTTSSKIAGWTTGRSAGFAPRRIWPTYF